MESCTKTVVCRVMMPAGYIAARKIVWYINVLMINGYTFFCPVTTLFQHNTNSFWGVRLGCLYGAHAEVITILPEKSTHKASPNSNDRPHTWKRTRLANQKVVHICPPPLLAHVCTIPFESLSTLEYLIDGQNLISKHRLLINKKPSKLKKKTQIW